MSHLVIHKIDIGKVKTSTNVMKLLKLLLTVIVKHPVEHLPRSKWINWEWGPSSFCIETKVRDWTRQNPQQESKNLRLKSSSCALRDRALSGYQLPSLTSFDIEEYTFHIKSSSVSSSASTSAPHVSTPPNYLTSPQPFYNKTHDCHKTFV